MTSNFPGFGHKFLVDFVAFRVELSFTMPSSLTYSVINPDGTKAGSETVQIGIENISSNIFLVTWQEHDKTTVVHVEDFAKNTIVTNIINPDLTFEQHHGTFDEIGGAQ